MKYQISQGYTFINAHKDNRLGETVTLNAGQVVDVVEETSTGISFLCGGEAYVSTKDETFSQVFVEVESVVSSVE